MTRVILSLQEKVCLPTCDSSHDSDSSIHYLLLLLLLLDVFIDLINVLLLLFLFGVVDGFPKPDILLLKHACSILSRHLLSKA